MPPTRRSRLNRAAALTTLVLLRATALAAVVLLSDLGTSARADQSSADGRTPPDVDRQALRQLRAARTAQPIAIEPNEGQAESSVAFVARALDYNVVFDRSGALRELDDAGATTGFSLAGGYPKPAVTPERRLQETVTYPAVDNKPYRPLPTYERVRYHEVYDGIDLLYHSKQGRLEYDFIVAPGAHFEAIRMRVEGAKSLSIDSKSGDLILTRENGSVVRHSRPRVYEEGPRRTPVSGRYALLDHHTVGFVVGAYDHTRTLVIDPTIVTTQFIMGSGHDLPTAIAVDGAGTAYITGTTDSARGWPNGNPRQLANFPPKDCGRVITGGRYCSTSAFLMKIASSGTILNYSLWGGTGLTVPLAIAVDSSNVYVAGGSTSSDISGNGAGNGARYDSATPAGAFRAFAAKFDLTALSPWSVTTLGASGVSQAHGLAVDAAQNMYVTGSACGTGFPTSDQFLHPIQQAVFAGGFCDAFVAKIDPYGFLNSGYSTYLGGEGFDVGYAITVDSVGAAWVTGQTCSRSFPLTNTQPDHGIAGAFGGCTAFVTKLDSAGLLQGSTLLGGHVWVDENQNLNPPVDEGLAVTLNGNNGVYIGGDTGSPNFYTDGGVLMYDDPCAPTAANQPLCLSGFVALINGGFDIEYSTYFGGSSTSSVTSIGRNSNGEIYVGGTTNGWQGFPGAPQVTPNPSAGYLSKLSGNLNSALWTQFQGAAVSGLAIQPSTSRISQILGGATIYTTGVRLPPVTTGGDAYEDGFMLRVSDPSSLVIRPRF